MRLFYDVYHYVRQRLKIVLPTVWINKYFLSPVNIQLLMPHAPTNKGQRTQGGPHTKQTTIHITSHIWELRKKIQSLYPRKHYKHVVQSVLFK